MYVPTHVQIAQTDNCQHHDNEKEVGWNQRNEADLANRLLHGGALIAPADHGDQTGRRNAPTPNSASKAPMPIINPH